MGRSLLLHWLLCNLGRFENGLPKRFRSPNNVLIKNVAGTEMIMMALYSIIY